MVWCSVFNKPQSGCYSRDVNTSIMADFTSLNVELRSHGNSCHGVVWASCSTSFCRCKNCGDQYGQIKEDLVYQDKEYRLHPVGTGSYWWILSRDSMAKFVFCKVLGGKLRVAHVLYSFYKWENRHRDIKYLIAMGIEENIGKTKTHELVGKTEIWTQIFQILLW